MESDSNVRQTKAPCLTTKALAPGMPAPQRMSNVLGSFQGYDTTGRLASRDLARNYFGARWLNPVIAAEHLSRCSPAACC
jgi:hypothetical protein